MIELKDHAIVEITVYLGEEYDPDSSLALRKRKGLEGRGIRQDLDPPLWAPRYGDVRP